MPQTQISILKVFLLSIVMLSSQAVMAQKTKQQLEKEKKDNLARIKEAEKILEETESQKTNTLGQLRALNEKIKATNQLIETIKKEITLLADEASEKEIVIEALNEDLQTLKNEYSKMIWVSYRSSRGYSLITFLFTASSFNQFVKRLQYLRQYSEARQNQLKQIEIVKNTLQKEKDQIESIRSEKSELLEQELKESKNLSTLQNKQANVFKELQLKEEELRAEVRKRKKAIDELDKLIAKLVRDELAKAQTARVTAANEEISKQFEASRSKLTWPVKSGFVSSPFGKQPHPVLKGILVENRGIDIQTSKSAPVYSVFDGVVAQVATVPGMNNVVLIRHGDYYTLYAKIMNVSVKKGDVVLSGQEIGQVASNSEGISELQFQLWNKSNKQDPQKWLVKK